MQYQLFTVLNLTQRFLKALEKLDINLNEIEDEQEKISQFYHLVSKIVERFLEQDEEEKYENENTEISLSFKDKCGRKCCEIQNIIMNQSNSNDEYFSTKIEESIDALLKNKPSTPTIIFLDFLSDSKYLKNS